jgi:O-6-methylguanine DNA methyltransferase
MKQLNSRQPKPISHTFSIIHIGYLPSTPIGPLWIAVSDKGLLALDWSGSQEEFTRFVERRHSAKVLRDDSLTAGYLRQIAEYLQGIRQQFTIPLDLSGLTPFQVQALRYTLDIPYGQTSTYQKIANRMEKPHAARAVGRAEATNPIPLIIPCHRVLGTDGSLHGYGGPGGIKLKAWLLELEGANNQLK